MADRRYASEDEAFAHQFRAAREAAGLTQDEVARHLAMRGFDFHQSTIYKIESGKRRVSVGEAVALAEKVGVAVEILANRFPDSPESLANEVRLVGKDFLEQLEDVAHSVVSARIQRLVYLDAVRRYSEAPTGFVKVNGEQRPLSDFFLILAQFPGLSDFAKAWEELLDNSAVEGLIVGFGYDLEELRETTTNLSY